MRNIIIAFCLALSFSFTATYSVHQDSKAANCDGYHPIFNEQYSETDYTFSPQPEPKDPTNNPGGEKSNPLCGSNYCDFYSPDKRGNDQNANHINRPDEIEITVVNKKAESTTFQEEPLYKVPNNVDSDGWLCEPPLLPTDEEPIFEDGGKAPNPCVGEPPLWPEPTLGEPPLPPMLSEPPLATESAE